MGQFASFLPVHLSRRPYIPNFNNNVTGRYHLTPSATESVPSFYSVYYSYCSEEWIRKDGNSGLRSLYPGHPYCFGPEPCTRTYQSALSSPKTIGRRRICLEGISISLCHQIGRKRVSPLYRIGPLGRSLAGRSLMCSVAAFLRRFLYREK